MLILISRVAGGYFVDTLHPRDGMRPLVTMPVPADQAFRLARAHGAADDEAWAALADADRRWRRVLGAWDRDDALGGPTAIQSSGVSGGSSQAEPRSHDSVPPSLGARLRTPDSVSDCEGNGTSGPEREVMGGPLS